MIYYDSIAQALRIQGLETGDYRLQVFKQGFIIVDAPFSGEGMLLPRTSLKYQGVPLCGLFTARVLRRYDEDMADFTRFSVEPRQRRFEHRQYGDILGTNYTPAGAANQIQLWEQYQLLRRQVQKELAIAAGFGLNSLRVFLHNLPFEKDEDAFLHQLDCFVEDCAAQRIRPLFVLFDDCWYGYEDVVMDFEPIPGMHNGRWAKCPLLPQRTLPNYPRFHRYVTTCIGHFLKDERVLGWDIWNEPKNLGMPDADRLDPEFTEDLMANAFDWARALSPAQALVACWSGNHWGDADNVHNYGAATPPHSTYDGVGCHVDRVRGTLVTEAGCRRWGTQPYGSTTDWVRWLSDRRTAGLPTPGVYLNWELMAGASNCAWHWSSEKGDPYPSVPWCGFLFPDGTPVHLAEVETLRRYAGLPHKIQMYHGFSSPTELPESTLAAGHFSIRSGILDGELVHAHSEESCLTLCDEVAAPFTAQLYVRLAPSARGGITFKFGGEEARVELLPDEVTLRIGERKLRVKAGVIAGQDSNLKIGCADNRLRVWVNDLSAPLIECATDFPGHTAKVALVAAGDVCFDDLIVVHSNGE
jgi:hypothetical protein